MPGVGTAGKEGAERYREGKWVGAPVGTLGQVAVGGKVNGGGLGVPEEHKGRMYGNPKEAPGGGRGVG